MLAFVACRFFVFIVFVLRVFRQRRSLSYFCCRVTSAHWY